MSRKSLDTKEELRQTIIARRHARGDTDITPEFRQPEFLELTPVEMEKKERRREQNRRAAQRCRSKKRQNQNKVLQNFEKILESNNDLRNQMQALTRERDDLRQRWHKHEETCPVLSLCRQNINGIVKKEPMPESINAVTVKKELIPPTNHADTVLKASDVNTTTPYGNVCNSFTMPTDDRSQLGSYYPSSDTENSPMSSHPMELNYNVNNAWYPQAQCMNYPGNDHKPIEPGEPLIQQRQFNDIQTQAPYSNFMQHSSYPTTEQYQAERTKTYPDLSMHPSNANNSIPPQHFQRFQQLPSQQASQQQDQQHLQTTQASQQQPFIQNKQRFGLPQHQQAYSSQPTAPASTPGPMDKSKSIDQNNKYPDIRRLLQSPCQTPLVNNNMAVFSARFSPSIVPQNTDIQIDRTKDGIQGRPRPNSNGAFDTMKVDINHTHNVKSIADGGPRPRSQSGDSATNPTCRFGGGNRLRHTSMGCSFSIEEPTRRMDGSRMSSVSSDASSIPESVTSLHRDERLREVNEAETDDVFSSPILQDISADETGTSPMNGFQYDLNNNDSHNFDSPAGDDRRGLGGRGFTNMETESSIASTPGEVSSFPSLNDGDIGQNHDISENDGLCDSYFGAIDDPIMQIPAQDLIFFQSNQFNEG